MTLAPGTFIQSFQIIALAGSGGMAEVYRARDTRLDRLVALKFLPIELTRDDEAKQRFVQEAKVASSLDHPNICTIHEIGESPDGRLFIAMAFYDGETLKKRIERAPLPVEEALDLAIQAASGLVEAHKAGIVHRDIKGANLILTSQGLVKILDFGLAKLAGQVGLTRTGATMGTVAYMSPEQASGREVDHRTDIWALGVVLYEMLAGRTPFAGENMQAVMHGILSREVESLQQVRPETPASVWNAVRHALEKDRDRRYQKTTEFLADLRQAKREMETAVIRAAEAASRSKPSIAVLPFSNMSPDPEQEYFCDGLAEELIDAFAQLDGVRVVARTSAFHFKGQTQDIRRIGEQLNAQTVLEGSVRKAGNRLRINAQLINVADGYHIWSGHYDRTIEDVFAVQEEIARSIVEKLKIKLVGAGDQPLVRRSTDNLEAYQLYLKGLQQHYRLSRPALEKAMAYFEEALAKEPRYAEAAAGISRIRGLLSVLGWVPPHEAMPKAREAALRALSMDDAAAEAHQAMAMVHHWYDWDWAAAEHESQRAIELRPGAAAPRSSYALLLLNRGRTEEAIAQVRHALELDPLSLDANRNLAAVLWIAGRVDAVIDEAGRTLRLERTYFPVRWYLAEALLAKGEYGQALSVMEEGRSDAQGDPVSESILGRIYARVGRVQEAREILHQLKQRRKEGYLTAARIAYVHAWFGETDQAIEWFHQAYTDRDGLCATFKTSYSVFSRELASLRSDPRFQALLERIERGGKD